MFDYKPNQKAVELVRHLNIKVNGKEKHVGIGGSVPERGIPPQIKPAIPEATKEEYRILYEDYKMTGLIDKIELKMPSNTDSPKKKI